MSVLWVLLLLSAVAGAAAYLARADAIVSHRALEIARARAAADAAIIQAISDLSDDDINRHPRLGDGLVRGLFDGIETSTTITAESGRIDLNAADESLIRSFLESQGINTERAAKMVTALRSNPGVPSALGVLRAAEELRDIPQWQLPDLDCWIESLTVYTGLSGISVVHAQPSVRRAWQWQQEHYPAEGARGEAAALDPDARKVVLGEVLRIRSTASNSRDVVGASEWVGRLTGDRQKPMLTLRWDHVGGTQPAECEKRR